MKIDYKNLDDALCYLYKHEANTTVKDYFNQLSESIQYSVCIGLFQTLLDFDLIDSKHDVTKGGETYIINLKGRDLLQKGKSTKDLHDDINKREELENKILKGTIESYQTSKEATNLNKYQLAVTIILGAVSALTILFQYQANKIAQKNLEISERAYKLELDNKNRIDTIFVKMNTQKPLK